VTQIGLLRPSSTHISGDSDPISGHIFPHWVAFLTLFSTIRCMAEPAWEPARTLRATGKFKGWHPSLKSSVCGCFRPFAHAVWSHGAVGNWAIPDLLGALGAVQALGPDGLDGRQDATPLPVGLLPRSFPQPVWPEGTCRHGAKPHLVELVKTAG
jgi:hypothetical protein